MDLYASDEEKVEALKRWWKENARSLIVGVVLGLALVFGWRAWVNYGETRAEQASSLYEQMTQSLNAGETETAIQQAKEIVSEYADSAYAVLSSLALAKIYVEQNELDTAGNHLRWALEHAEMPGLKDVARLRLARVLRAQGEAGAALELTSQVNTGAFAAEYAELQGDLYREQGELEQARAAYRRALEHSKPGAARRELVQMKLDDIAGAVEQEQQK